MEPTPNTDCEPGPCEVKQTPGGTAAKIDTTPTVEPEPGPSEVKKTPVTTATTIETVEDDDPILKPNNPKHVSKPTVKKTAMDREEAGKAARKAKRVARVRNKEGMSSTGHQEALSAFLSSVRRGEQGPDSSMPFDDLDEMLDGLAALGEDLPDIDDPTSFRAAMMTDYRKQW